MKESHKHFGLALLSVTIIAATLLLPPIGQSNDYHQFVDQRALFNIPNFGNVISNLPFIAVALIGLHFVRHIPRQSVTLAPLRPIYWLFFIGVALTGIGSSYYHWAPSNPTLVWDRAPMTISFMAFFCILLGEQVSARLARGLIFPLLALGLASVFWWRYTELQGAGDLRPYILVQFLPLLLIPLLLLCYRSPFNCNRTIWMVILLYGLSKLAEHFDQLIYSSGVSGHSIKHILAAAGAYCVYLALKNRSPDNEVCPRKH